MTKKIRAIFVTLGLVLVVLAAYVLIHESGHAIVAALCGARITKLSILGAHTSWIGGSFTAGTLSLNHAAGALLPICVLTLGTLLYRKDFKGPVYHLAYFYSLIICATSLSVWVFFPILSMFAPLPATDDVTKFLQSSGLPPAVVSLVSVALILLVLFLAKRKGMFREYVSTLKSMMSTETEDGTSFSKKTVWKLTAALLIVIAAAILPELPEAMAEPVISFSSEGQDAITDYENSFEIRYDRDYPFDIRLDAGGFLTVIRIQDSEQGMIYHSITEETSSSGSIYLNKGRYMISVIYLKDLDAFERYCEDYDDMVDESVKEELRSVYENDFKPPVLSVFIQ